ncbi:hypothetical protein GGR56DRAFT_6386 [Xylariaceae sp. FL0804]|nr:hypothetical protein GGR56DRAFT_6386 [Xylariaceae sp. FL0804]
MAEGLSSTGRSSSRISSSATLHPFLMLYTDRLVYGTSIVPRISLIPPTDLTLFVFLESLVFPSPPIAIHPGTSHSWDHQSISSPVSTGIQSEGSTTSSSQRLISTTTPGTVEGSAAPPKSIDNPGAASSPPPTPGRGGPWFPSGALGAAESVVDETALAIGGETVSVRVVELVLLPPLPTCSADPTAATAVGADDDVSLAINRTVVDG